MCLLAAHTSGNVCAYVLICHFCGPVPKGSRPSNGPRPGGWRALTYMIITEFNASPCCHFGEPVHRSDYNPGLSLLPAMKVNSVTMSPLFSLSIHQIVLVRKNIWEDRGPYVSP